MQGKTPLFMLHEPLVGLASMRPPRNAGENWRLNFWPSNSPSGFNEAPAKCRGKQCGAGGADTSGRLLQ